MTTFRLDRSAFKIQTFAQAAQQRNYWLSKTPQERIEAAWYLICVAYKLEHHSKHKLDRTYFEMKKRQ